MNKPKTKTIANKNTDMLTTQKIIQLMNVQEKKEKPMWSECYVKETT